MVLVWATVWVEETVEVVVTEAACTASPIIAQSRPTLGVIVTLRPDWVLLTTSSSAAPDTPPGEAMSEKPEPAVQLAGWAVWSPPTRPRSISFEFEVETVTLGVAVVPPLFVAGSPL